MVIIANQPIKCSHDQFFVGILLISYVFIASVYFELVDLEIAFLDDSFNYLFSILWSNKFKSEVSTSMEIKRAPILPIFLLKWNSRRILAHVHKHSTAKAEIKL